MAFALPRKARFFWVYPLLGLLVVTARISDDSFRVGVFVVALGEFLRVWANGYVGHLKVNSRPPGSTSPKVGHLITAGPYAFIRHPLYIGSFLIGLGFCIIAASVWLALACLLFFVILYGAKVKGEEALIREEWGAEHEAYCRAVPRWWPALRPYANPYGTWTWQGIRASKELKTVVWVIVALLAAYFFGEFFQERDQIFGESWLKHLILLTIFCVLIVTEGVTDLSRRWRQRAARSLQPSA